MPQGRMPGLQDLLKQLRQRRQQQLKRYDLGSALDDIKKKVDEILKTEREGIEQRRTDARERAERGEIPESARQQLAEMAAQREAALDQLPPDPAGRIRQLQNYEFMDPEAWRMFQEMMQSLLAKDERLDAALAQLAMNLDQLMPLDELRRRYDFRGDDPVTLREAMRLMEELAQMEKLERQLRRAQDPASLEQLDPGE